LEDSFGFVEAILAGLEKSEAAKAAECAKQAEEEKVEAEKRRKEAIALAASQKTSRFGVWTKDELERTLQERKPA